MHISNNKKNAVNLNFNHYLKKKLYRFIVEDINNLVVVEPDETSPKLEKGKIIMNFRLKHCEVSEINKFDPKRVTLRNIKQEEDLIVGFDDEKIASFTASFLNKNKRDIKKLEMALIIRILHQAENDLLPLNS